MQTTSAEHSNATLTTGAPDAVERFLETLMREQAHFLDAVRHASSLLSGRPGQLAHVAAIQSRLTQQFFDAQRSIMRRRAEFDAEVESIGQVTADNIAVLLEAAREIADEPQAVAFHELTGEVFDPLSLDVWSRGDVAALTAAVVRTTAEADTLSCVVTDAFEPSEPDGATLQRQLAEVLDDWWQVQNAEGRVVVDLARARAATRWHIAQIEAGEIVEAARDAAPIRRPTSAVDVQPPLPEQVAAILDQAHVVNLDTVLTMLVDTLTPPPPAFDPPSGPPVSFEALALSDVVNDGSSALVEQRRSESDARRDFWTESATSRRTMRWPRAAIAAATGPGGHDHGR